MWNISIYTPGVLSLVKAVVFYNWFWLSQDFKTYHQVYGKKQTNNEPSTINQTSYAGLQCEVMLFWCLTVILILRLDSRRTDKFNSGTFCMCCPDSEACHSLMVFGLYISYLFLCLMY